MYLVTEMALKPAFRAPLQSRSNQINRTFRVANIIKEENIKLILSGSVFAFHQNLFAKCLGVMIIFLFLLLHSLGNPEFGMVLECFKM